MQGLAPHIDPVAFNRWLWPQHHFYREQREIAYSVEDDDETYAYAGNMLGKDFDTAAIIIKQYLCNKVARIVTTSVKDDHLRVLWGEIGRLIQEASVPLTYDKGGPLVIKHREITKVDPATGQKDSISYIKGMVSADEEGLAGHHAPYTLAVGDEASGLKNSVHVQFQGWARRMLFIGNPNECDNFYRLAEREGPIPRDNGKGYHRRVIYIDAEASPNVRYARAEIAAGLEPSDRVIVPGVLTWNEYCKRLKTWNKIRQHIGLRGRFWEGAEVLLFPPSILDWSNKLADKLRGTKRQVRAIGCDPAEGGDKSAWVGVDEYGVVFCESHLTPDTTVIPEITERLMKDWGVPDDRVIFDRGGGGKQAVDVLRKRGHRRVRTLAFGSAPTLDIKRGRHQFVDRKDVLEDRGAYVNMRAELYGELSLACQTTGDTGGFAIPEEYVAIRNQLQPIPRKYDGEQRLFLPPKNRRPGQQDEGNIKCLVDLIGHSPDEADALVLAYHGMQHKCNIITAGGGC